jgi:hypothetical protein
MGGLTSRVRPLGHTSVRGIVRIMRSVALLLALVLAGCGDSASGSSPTRTPTTAGTPTTLTGGDDARRFLIEVNHPDCPGLSSGLGALPTIGRDDIVSWRRYEDPAGRDEDPGGRYEQGIELVLSSEKAAEIAGPFEGPVAGHNSFRFTVGSDSYCGMLTFPISQAAINGWALITSRGPGNEAFGVFDVLSLAYGFGGGYVDDADLLDKPTVVEILDRIEGALPR